VQLPRIQKLWVETDEDDPSNDAKLVKAADLVPPNPEPRKKKPENRKQKTETRILDPNPEPRAPNPQTLSSKT
jgi:hypothetical protein